MELTYLDGFLPLLAGFTLLAVLFDNIFADFNALAVGFDTFSQISVEIAPLAARICWIPDSYRRLTTSVYLIVFSSSFVEKNL